MMSFDVASRPSLLCVTRDRVCVACNDHAHSSYSIDMYCLQDKGLPCTFSFQRVYSTRIGFNGVGSCERWLHFRGCLNFNPSKQNLLRHSITHHSLTFSLPTLSLSIIHWRAREQPPVNHHPFGIIPTTTSICIDQYGPHSANMDQQQPPCPVQ